MAASNRLDKLTALEDSWDKTGRMLLGDTGVYVPFKENILAQDKFSWQELV